MESSLQTVVMEGLSAKDLQIFREKGRAFCGSVKIPLDKLQHEELPDNPRQLDPKNVARLVDIFRGDDDDGDGCDRWDPLNHVPVLIPRSALPEVPLGVGDDLRLFNPDQPLIHLHGRHRLEAAREFLIGNDRWWIADLFSDDLSLLVKNVLRENDPNCAKYYDGDILRHIRISTIRGDRARRKKWLLKLTKSKQNYVKRLEALPEKFLDSLDALIPFAGLWPAIHIGTFLRLSKLHCPEEMTRYLRRVKDTMTCIIGKNENDGLLIEPNTASLLQGRCPGLSYEDRAFVQMRMDSRELFPTIKDDSRRSQIFDNLCLIKHVIISIHTFLEDTKYLEPCARILMKLLPSKCKGSLSQYFRDLHSRQANVKVQTSEFTFEDRILSSSRASWMSYRMLWLLTLRHFPVMDGQAPRKDVDKRNKWQPGLQFRWWVELSALALDNGYSRIRQLYRDRKAADISTIEDCVRRILPSNYYKIDEELMRRKVKLIYELIGEIPRVETVATTPKLTSDYDNCRPDISDRCGRPRVSALQADEGYLFLDHIYSTAYDTTPKRYLTSFAITRDVFHSFFGTAEDDLDQYYSLPILRNDHDGNREESDRMQDVEDAERPATNHQPLHEAPLPSDLTGMFVESTQSTSLREYRSRSPDRRRRSRSASPHTLHRSVRRRERSASYERDRRRRRYSGSPHAEDTSTALIPLPHQSVESLEETDTIMTPLVSHAEDTSTALIPLAHQSVESLEETDTIMTSLVSPLPATQPSTAPMFIFGQEVQERTITLKDARRFLFRKRIRKSRSFTVLSPAGKDRFRICQANSTDAMSMVNALQLPSEAPFLTSDQGKRLRLTAPTTILEEARSQRLDTALVVSQHNAGELIRQFEGCEEEEEELRHKEPHKGMEVVKVGKPIIISICDDGDWKIAEKNVLNHKTEERIRYFMWRYKGLRPYDWEGNAVSVEECYDAAQRDSPATIYLCTPEQAGSIPL